MTFFLLKNPFKESEIWNKFVVYVLAGLFGSSRCISAQAVACDDYRVILLLVLDINVSPITHRESSKMMAVAVGTLRG